MFQHLLPRLLEIIYEINAGFLREVANIGRVTVIIESATFDYKRLAQATGSDGPWPSLVRSHQRGGAITRRPLT